VDFGDPVNLVPVAAGIILAVGDVKLQITKDFPLQGIAFGTIVVLVGYHALAAAQRTPRDAGGGIIAPGERETVTDAPGRPAAEAVE
jgi:hypothetical protein